MRSCHAVKQINQTKTKQNPSMDQIEKMEKSCPDIENIMESSSEYVSYFLDLSLANFLFNTITVVFSAFQTILKHQKNPMKN